jgi:hypothetical protein
MLLLLPLLLLPLLLLLLLLLLLMAIAKRIKFTATTINLPTIACALTLMSNSSNCSRSCIV